MISKTNDVTQSTIFEHGSSTLFASWQHEGLLGNGNSAGKAGKQRTNNLWSGLVKDKIFEENYEQGIFHNNA